jgi:hypothetical protein
MIRLWDMRYPQGAPRVLAGHRAGVISVAFSADGRWLVSGSDDDTMRLWIVSLEDLAEIGCRQVRRNLTRTEWAKYLPEQPYRQTCAQWPPVER